MELNRAIIEAAIAGFERQKVEIDQTIAQLRADLKKVEFLEVFEKASRSGGQAKSQSEPTPRKTRIISTSARKRMAAGQKKRWARFHAKKKKSGKTA
jgi:hypothetical protein